MIGWDGNISGDKRWLTDGAMLLKSRGVAVTIGKRMRAWSMDSRKVTPESIERCFADAIKGTRGWKRVELPRPRVFDDTRGGLFAKPLLHANGIPFDANRIEVIYRALGNGIAFEHDGHQTHPLRIIKRSRVVGLLRPCKRDFA